MMTILNLSILNSFELVKYFKPSTDTEDVLYQALIDGDYDKQALNNELDDLTDKVWSLEKKLQELEDDYEDQLEKLKDENFELAEKIKELEEKNEKHNNL
jgi:predicted  nucleic acid-binding Zn-ribbon protein